MEDPGPCWILHTMIQRVRTFGEISGKYFYLSIYFTFLGFSENWSYSYFKNIKFRQPTYLV